MKLARKIELLAPAKNLESGIEAINHGADAVYIGAPKFSARSAAGNSLEDIQKLVEYAHIYWVKVYVALNTILYDNELQLVEKMIHQLYTMGVDALIIQDMGILKLDLPPIPLHASTQCDNRNIEKIRFLEEAGFSQIVLARELSLDEIKDISKHTSVALEAFVHGALCVSYSGQCYISQALAGRSANRGECAQFCRLPYTLQDGNGKVITANKHLLSLKDLNQSDNLEELLDSGISSLKIEGRLKELSYVKNTTSYYRQKLDAVFEKRPEYIPTSSGKSIAFFIPDPSKSFNRGFTEYFLHGRNKSIISPETPKSLGESIGNIKDINKNYFTISGQKKIHNGDGLCFINERKELQGFRVNRVEGDKVFPFEMPALNQGLTVYRNFDHEFEKILSKKSAERKIGIELLLEENNFGFSLTATDEDSCSATITIPFSKEISHKNQEENIRLQLSKFGNTPFELKNLTINLSDNWFIPSSILSSLRQKVTERLLSVRKINYRNYIRKANNKIPLYPEKDLMWTGNVSNKKAKEFYMQSGVKTIQSAFELNTPSSVPVMHTKHCIKYQLGYCPKYHKDTGSLKEPLTLITGKNQLLLKFDCNNCEMKIIH